MYKKANYVSTSLTQNNRIRICGFLYNVLYKIIDFLYTLPFWVILMEYMPEVQLLISTEK